MATASSREEWERHPNAHGPAGMMLHIHDGFRRASAALVAESASASPSRGRIRSIFGELASVLHHHHHAEEVLLFPRLAEAGVAAPDLEGDHRRLLAAIEAVREVIAAGDDASAALRELDELLRAHLEVEESVSIPYLLEHPWI